MSSEPKPNMQVADPSAARSEPVVGGERKHRRPSAGIVIPSKPPGSQPLSRRYALGPLMFAVLLALVVALMVWFQWRRQGESLQDKFRQLGRGVDWVAGLITGLDADLTGGDDPEARAAALRAASGDVVEDTSTEVKSCFERFGPADRDYTKVQVYVEVDPEGRVKSARLRDTFGDGPLADCVTHAVVGARWPSGAWGHVTLNYPLPKVSAE